MYFFLTSDSNREYYPANTVNSFRVKLPNHFSLHTSDNWSVALLDISLPRLTTGYTPDFITVNSPLCHPSVVNSSLQPILRRFYYKEIGENPVIIPDSPHYMTINTASLDDIHIYLSDHNGSQPSFESGRVCCTLHFKKNPPHSL